MNKIYDTDSDQLKCSFCTTYFKCTLHFANLQRYALKACPKCIHNFSYSLLHPQSFQLYRLLLLDVGIAIAPKTQAPNDDLPTARSDLQAVIDDLNSKISLYYEEKIVTLMREMDKIKDNLQTTFRKIEEDYADVFNLTAESNASRIAEAQEVIQKLRRYETSRIMAEKGRLLGKEEGKDLLKSIRKSPRHRLDKENIQSSNYSNVSKLLKSKICGTSSSRNLANSTSNSKLLTQSREKGFGKSRISRSIIKSIELGQSVVTRFEEQDRAEVARLLDQRFSFETYMPREVSKQSNVCLKSEGSRNVVESVLELKSRTARTDHIVELIGGDASKTNFGCYLRSLRELKEVKTVRMIGCSLVDADMDQLLHLLTQMPEVETLIVTNNRLTELSVEAVAAFRERHPQSRLSNVYLGNNHISSRWMRRQTRQGQLSIHF